jgi:hypothetical protein
LDRYWRWLPGELVLQKESGSTQGGISDVMISGSLLKNGCGLLLQLADGSGKLFCFRHHGPGLQLGISALHTFRCQLNGVVR